MSVELRTDSGFTDSPANGDDDYLQRNLCDYTNRLLVHFEQDIFCTDPPFPKKTAANLNDTIPELDLEAPKNAEEKRLAISFAGLHRMRLRKLQIQLASHVIAMHFECKERPGWEGLLQEYSTQGHIWLVFLSLSLLNG